MKIILSFIISIIFFAGKTSYAQTFEYLPLFSYEQANFSDWLQKKIKFPKKTDFKGETVKVIVQYSVLTNRSIDNIQVLSDSPEAFRNETIRVLKKSPLWAKPCMINRQAKNHTDTLTILFAPKQITVIPTRTRPTFNGQHFTEFSRWITSRIANISTVSFDFTITENGKLENIRITECQPQSIYEQLKKVIQDSPKWQPATRNGQPFRSNENLVIQISPQ